MGLYKGMTAPLLYVIPLASISFGAYAGGCELIAQNNPTKELKCDGLHLENHFYFVYFVLVQFIIFLPDVLQDFAAVYSSCQPIA